MIHRWYDKLILVISASIIYSSFVTAEVYFAEDFNDCAAPLVGTPSPVISLPSSFSNAFGPRDFFSIASDGHGGCGLKISYIARNQLCNQCGGRTVTHKSGVGTGTYLVSSTGADLTLSDDVLTTKPDDGPKALVGRSVINTTRGASIWQIQAIGNQSSANDRLDLILKTPGVGGETVISAGDSLLIARACGQDGIIGTVNGLNDVDRRSDCDQLITWFSNVPAQSPGSSIFRRRYLKQTMGMPTQHQKLGYVVPDSGGPNQGSVVIFADMKNGIALPNVSGLLRYGAPLGMYMPSNSSLAGKKFDQGVWYYLEEEYQAATVKTFDSAGKPIEYNPDGAFRLWMGAVGEEPARLAPTLEVRGISLPPIKGGAGQQMSMWGNFQHWTDSIGEWYMDDYVVSNSYNGATNAGNISPPNSPSLQVN